MSRQADAQSLAVVEPVPVELPPINWTSIGAQAPRLLAQGSRATADPLPSADIVVVTWTTAEWNALDHVFANSGATRGNGLGAWDKEWFAYNRNVGNFTSDVNSDPLWGMFRRVSVVGKSQTWTVLLFHSNAHLQYDPYIAGLRAMVASVLSDTGARYLYSIGTAGGGALNQRLGDPVVTNGAQLLPGTGPNVNDPANGKTFTCQSWYPPTSLFGTVQTLLFPLSNVVTLAELQSMFERFANKYAAGALTLQDLLNAALQPANLNSPTIHNCRGLPLDTSCNFAMAPAEGSSQYSAYEEDDAAVGQAAQLANVNFAFIRNVSDTVVPSAMKNGSPISDYLRSKWASLLYDRYGLITASNGALATWAAIAAS